MNVRVCGEGKGVTPLYSHRALSLARAASGPTHYLTLVEAGQQDGSHCVGQEWRVLGSTVRQLLPLPALGHTMATCVGVLM